MDKFSNEMKKYGKLVRSSKNHVTMIDDMFYRNFKVELLRTKTDSLPSYRKSKTSKRKLKKQTKDLILKMEDSTN